MDLARVVGTIVATQKDEALVGTKLCVIQPLTEYLEPQGKPLVATDASAARGYGEIVYFVTSGDAVYTGPGGRVMPVDAAIVGIVDHVDLNELVLKRFKS
jgi:ethanolamine utilization protein EutN